MGRFRVDWWLQPAGAAAYMAPAPAKLTGRRLRSMGKNPTGYRDWRLIPSTT
jgi:hypothetical protein